MTISIDTTDMASAERELAEVYGVRLGRCVLNERGWYEQRSDEKPVSRVLGVGQTASEARRDAILNAASWVSAAS
jgi:hypothetical protein